MRKNSTTTPQTPAQPNAPVMSQVSPVKAMPAPVPSGATTSPPMNQAKMADEQEEHRRVPHGTIGGAVGGLGGLAATLPSVFQAYRDLPVRLPDGHSDLYALERGKFHKSLGRAAGATLLSAALGLGLERLARGMTPIARKVHDVKSEPEKTAGAREFLQKVLDAKDKYIADPLASSAGAFAEAFGVGLGRPIDSVRHLPGYMFDRRLPLPSRAVNTAGALAGIGTLGYGAYRGGKALVHKLTADDEEE